MIESITEPTFLWCDLGHRAVWGDQSPRHGRIGADMSEKGEHGESGADVGTGNPAATHQAIGNEHLQLEALIAGTEAALSSDPPDSSQVLELARELLGAMEAHFVREESLYYPTLWALQPAVEASLKALVSTHENFRTRLGALVGSLERGEVGSAGRQLDEFSELFGDHEAAEERILASLQSAGRAEQSAP